MKRINTRFFSIVEAPTSRRGLKRAYDAEGRLVRRAKIDRVVCRELKSE